ncbi:MAG TPA: BadF/BadG/BcrA/BcrD ATPase family protein [Terriglobales bacterium]|nr:BadF/BadG/BcrA/BcrD ATPase family protein [Terriglobales bacterium]
MGLYIGIDGGGTKTDCVVGDDHAVLGRATTGGCKVTRVGEAEARANLQKAIAEACRAGRVEPRGVSRVCVGLAGASDTDSCQVVQRIVAEVVPASVEVVGDMVVAFEAAFREGAGVLVSAGTGSIAYGRNERGETARAGGWGPVVSDEGSGDWIGRAAVAAALRAFDAGTTTALAAGILNAWQVATRDDVARMANSHPPPDFAALFPIALTAADRGDALARDILIRAGTELAQLARIVSRRLWPGQSAVRVRICGGVFMNSFCVQQVFENSLRAERPDAAVTFGMVDAAAGALAYARRGATRPAAIMV